MIRAVLDANVIAAGFPVATGTPGKLIDRWREEAYEFVTSEHILDEVTRTWSKPYWRTRMTAQRIVANMAILRSEAEITPLLVEVTGVASHAADDLVLSAAATAQVDYLVTGDRELRQVGSYAGVTILSPRQVLAILDEESL